MSDTPKSGETGDAPKNDGSQDTPTPTQNVTEEAKVNDNSAAEKMKQELQQQMRANQVANEKLAKLEAEKQKEREKELEENNQFKELYEQEKAKREEFENERESAKRKAELDDKSKEVLADYSEEVRILAETAGTSLQDTDEDSVAAFKEKLDKVKGMLPEKKVTSNNPAPTNNQSTPSREEMVDIMHDQAKFHDYVTQKFPGIAAMTRQDSR